MLEGFTPWPPERAREYIDKGWWDNLTLWQMMARSVQRWPDKVALVAGGTRQT